MSQRAVGTQVVPISRKHAQLSIIIALVIHWCVDDLVSIGIHCAMGTDLYPPHSGYTLVSTVPWAQICIPTVGKIVLVSTVPHCAMGIGLCSQHNGRMFVSTVLRYNKFIRTAQWLHIGVHCAMGTDPWL